MGFALVVEGRNSYFQRYGTGTPAGGAELNQGLVP
jgi:hypothetical protein